MDKKKLAQANTPLMAQYQEIKAKHEDALLLFRMGDFYEAFGEDAHALHKVADIKLTKRSNGAAADVPLAGFPHHALDNYIPKLVEAGYRVAVCDQLEPPKKGKQVVKRAVTELVTPGLTYHDHLLKGKQNNYLASVEFAGNDIGLALLDISTGEFYVAQGDRSYISQLLQRFQPAELIFSKAASSHVSAFVGKWHQYPLERWIYQPNYASQLLLDHFQTTSLKGFGVHHLPHAITAAGGILHYLHKTQHTKLDHITHLLRIEKEHYMWLDRFTVQHLELIRSEQEEGIALIKVLDKTLTPMGGRKLKKWLLFPQQDITIIRRRHHVVGLLVDQEEWLQDIKGYLHRIGDVERLCSKVATGRINPRELYALGVALEMIAPLKLFLERSSDKVLQEMAKKIDSAPELKKKIMETLEENPPFQLNQSGYIRTAASSELHRLRALLSSGNAHLKQILERERRAMKIPSLKLGFNKVFGYYLEVTHTHKDKVPQTWIRKQTLTQAERYITPEIKQYEEEVLHAQEKIEVLEQSIYRELLAYVTNFIASLQKTAQELAVLDCYQSLAHVAKIYGYVKPKMHEGGALTIREGRHPVIEYALPPNQTYVPNDVDLDQEEQQILLITGPNMAGKSALLRQTALIVLLAHAGSFVPAKAALIPMTDKIFTRIGASDNLALQESTFMVEMNETASIIRNVSKRSLLIIDELGRGTGTSDGIALAQSILEYLQTIDERPKTLFATHYHSLNKLAAMHRGIQNYTVAVRETEGKILFLHKLERGASQHSFGIHVAQMAGIPDIIIHRASQLLVGAVDEETQRPDSTSPVPAPRDPSPIETAMSKAAQSIIEELEQIDPLRMTPLEASMKLQALVRILRENKK